jgi:hypothetical protein
VKRARVSLAAFVVLLACPGPRPESDAQNAPAQTSTNTRSPGAVTLPRATPAASPVTEVQLLEYEIRIADTLPAGPQQLRIANAGKEKHSLAIEGPGVSTRLPSELTRGDIAELAVTLQPGTYTVWCPVDKHRGKGMARMITVK